MLTFLPSVVALLLLGWVGVPVYVLIPLAVIWYYRSVRGKSWIARADHHAGADGKWLAGGQREWSELLLAWKSRPLPLLMIIICSGMMLWKGQTLPLSQSSQKDKISQGMSRSLESVGMKEMVEALKSPLDSKKLDEKLRLSSDESLQSSGGGKELSDWALSSWSLKRPFGEVE